MKKHVLIVAGGSGKRMNASIPKQFLPIDGKPILSWTIRRFREYDPNIPITVVLPSDQIVYWRQMCKNHKFSEPHDIVAGGNTRFESVKNGLATIVEQCLIAVHDGVRPLVSIDTIARTFNAAEENGAAIPSINLTDSLRKVEGEISTSLNRSEHRLIQTPQTFDSIILTEAYGVEYDSKFTDDASVVESSGGSVKLVEGNIENIKITNPTDLITAQALMSDLLVTEV